MALFTQTHPGLKSWKCWLPGWMGEGQGLCVCVCGGGEVGLLFIFQIVVRMDHASSRASARCLVSTALSANRTRRLLVRGHVCVGMRGVCFPENGNRWMPGSWWQQWSDHVSYFLPSPLLSRHSPDCSSCICRFQLRVKLTFTF